MYHIEQGYAVIACDPMWPAEASAKKRAESKAKAKARPKAEAKGKAKSEAWHVMNWQWVGSKQETSPQSSHFCTSIRHNFKSSCEEKKRKEPEKEAVPEILGPVFHLRHRSTSKSPEVLPLQLVVALGALTLTLPFELMLHMDSWIKHG